MCVCADALGKKNGMTGPSLGRTVRTRSGKLDPLWPSERLPGRRQGGRRQMGWKRKGHLSRERGDLRTLITTELCYHRSYSDGKMQFRKRPGWV